MQEVTGNGNGTNGWPSWGKHVLKELERLNEYYSHLDKRVANIERDLAVLKTQFSERAPKIDATNDRIATIEAELKSIVAAKRVEVKPKAIITGTLPPSILTFLWFLGKSNGWW